MGSRCRHLACSRRNELRRCWRTCDGLKHFGLREHQPASWNIRKDVIQLAHLIRARIPHGRVFPIKPFGVVCVHRHADRFAHLDGWPWALDGQRVLRTTVALAQTRGHLLEAYADWRGRTAAPRRGLRFTTPGAHIRRLPTRPDGSVAGRHDRSAHRQCCGHDGQRKSIAHVPIAATSTPVLRYDGTIPRDGNGRNSNYCKKHQVIVPRRDLLRMIQWVPASGGTCREEDAVTCSTDGLCRSELATLAPSRAPRFAV
jgi:hypothetical protein